jgi:voltage-dependent calcium channel N type alpha-1B
MWFVCYSKGKGGKKGDDDDKKDDGGDDDMTGPKPMLPYSSMFILTSTNP